MIKHIIVGTGLSSLAAVLSLVSKNNKPTVIDIGINKIKDNKVLKSDYSKLPYLNDFKYLFESLEINPLEKIQKFSNLLVMEVSQIYGADLFVKCIRKILRIGQ